jgi:enterochelin esterase-like enzyme
MRRGIALGLVVLAAVAGWIVLRDWRRGYESTRGATVSRFTVHSSLVDRDLHEILVGPAGDRRRRGLLVFLHGRSSSPDSNLRQPLFDALRDLGPRAPVVLLADGGDHSYWHDRRDGKWGTSLLREAIPAALSRSHADGDRVAIGGISMGGFGAFDIARRRPSAFCAVGGHSAAVWLRSGDTAPGAFDDAADFSRNDLVRLARARGRAPWGKARLWLDGGSADPFRVADERLAAALGIRMHHWAGGHDGAYWHRHYARYLRFYASALAAC